MPFVCCGPPVPLPRYWFWGRVVGPEQGGDYAPPGYYRLFLISNQGVPSIAEYVQVEAEED